MSDAAAVAALLASPSTLATLLACAPAGDVQRQRLSTAKAWSEETMPLLPTTDQVGPARLEAGIFQLREWVAPHRWRARPPRWRP